MKSFISKTFGGLDKSYYFRHFFFGLLVFIFLESMFFNAAKGVIDAKLIGNSAFFLLLTFLYPYSRFVYESVIGFILGNNIIFINVFVVLFTKMFTILLCYLFGWAIAPIGLIYLYFYHSKNS